MLQSTQTCPDCRAENHAQAVRCHACQYELSRTSRIVPTEWLPRGATLKDERYEIGDVIGEGGMSVVYRAWDKQRKKDVVMKRKGNKRFEEMQKERGIEQVVRVAQKVFQQEIVLLKSLEHPQIPGYIDDFCDEKDQQYLVMEFIEGMSLERLLEKAPQERLPLKDVLDYSIQLCDVLQYLHTRQPPIVFRDLKPSNIMLARNGTIYLIDFGIARFFRPGQPADTYPFFTKGHASPEQEADQQTAPSSDIYSMGIMMRQLLSGVVSLEREDKLSEIPSLASLGVTVPQALDTLIREMVSKKINNRPNIGAVKQRLQAIQKALVQSEAVAPIPSMAKPAIASIEEELSQEKGQYPYCYTKHQGAITLLSWSPDSTKLATASSTEAAHAWIASTGKVTEYTWERAIPALPSYVDEGFQVFAWSLDNMLLALGYNNGPVKILDVGTQTYRTMRARPGKPVYALAWSRDRRYLASGGMSCLYVWNVHRKTEMLKNELLEYDVTSLSWSPAGQFLAVGNSHGMVNIWSIREQLSVFCYRGHGGSKVSAVEWSPDGLHLASADSLGRVHIWRVM